MIRVLRVIEYTYPDFQTMDADMQGWTNSNRNARWKRGMSMRSTSFTPEFIDNADITEQEPTP